MEPTLVLSIASGVISILIGIALALFRSNVDSERRVLEMERSDNERRFSEIAKDLADTKTDLRTEVYRGIAQLDRDLRQLIDRLGVVEKNDVALDGRFDLVDKTSKTIESDISEIKKQMISKSEFESRSNSTDKMLNLILGKIDRTSYASSPTMAAVTRKDPRQDR